MLTFLALIVGVPAPWPASTVIRAEGFEVYLAAPKGWRIEAKPSLYDGLPAVVVRRGEDFRTAKSVMFLNLARRQGPALAAFVANRTAAFLKDRPGAKVRSAERLVAGDGTPATLLDFDDPKTPQHERDAYLETADGIATLFLQCPTPQARATHAPRLKELVESFRDLHAPHPG